MISFAGIFRILLAMPLLLVLWQGASAQIDAENKEPKRSPLLQTEDPCQKTGDQLMDEIRIKACIRQQQKEYRELLSNGEEAAKLSAEVEKAFDKTAVLASEDQKKLERLEKLFKKIRSSLGGEEDDPSAEEDKPMTLKTAIDALNEKASSLLDELKKTTRYSISVDAIQNSNIVIRLVRYIRYSKI
jgi:hypothetical protein